MLISQLKSKRIVGLFALCVGVAALALTTNNFRARAAGEHFADPSAQMRGHITLGDEVYVGPFATLVAEADHKIEIGAESDVQDNVTLEATKGDIILGEQVILAHGTTVKGAAEFGEHGTCPVATDTHCPSFSGFNSEVDGAKVEKDAMVGHLARLAPGLTLKSGLKILPGKNVTTQAEAEDTTLGKVAAVTQADRDFMHGVIEVNVEFAVQYAHMTSAEITGINADPNTTFNSGKNFPTLLGTSTQDGSFRNRIIGNVLLSNNIAQLDDVMGARISLRADEGAPFIFGALRSIGSNATVHALEHTGVSINGNARIESGSLIHGGPNSFNSNTTTAGFGFQLGAKSVFFASRIGALGRIGYKSAILATDFGNAANTRIGDCQVYNGGVKVGTVEWCY
ncbi:MAG: acetyltransferase [Acidobacteriota bacterium]